VSRQVDSNSELRPLWSTIVHSSRIRSVSCTPIGGIDVGHDGKIWRIRDILKLENGKQQTLVLRSWSTV
jgi:hypothetical protein